MATRRKKTKPIGCLQIAAAVFIVLMIASGLDLLNSLNVILLIVGVFMIPVLIHAIMKMRKTSGITARRTRAAKRHEPAVRLLTTLAYTDDKLSRGEKEVLTSYLRSYEDADPEAVFVKPASIPGIGEIDRLINRCNITLDPSETDLLVEHVRRLRGTRRTHAPAARDRFDEAERRLSRVTVTGPVINDITEA